MLPSPGHAIVLAGVPDCDATPDGARLLAASLTVDSAGAAIEWFMAGSPQEWGPGATFTWEAYLISVDGIVCEVTARPHPKGDHFSVLVHDGSDVGRSWHHISYLPLKRPLQFGPTSLRVELLEAEFQGWPGGPAEFKAEVRFSDGEGVYGRCQTAWAPVLGSEGRVFD